MNDNKELSTYDMVCRVFNPKYQPKREGAENEQNQELRRG